MEKMKKHYSAPQAYAESFRLCEHVAGECTIIGKPVGEHNEYLFEDENGSIILFHSVDGCATDVSHAEFYLGDTDAMVGS